MTEALKDLWQTLATVGPKFLLFVAILVVGWFIAKIVGGAVRNILTRLGFDVLLDRSGLSKVCGQIEYGNGAAIVGKLAYYSILLIVLQMAFGVFGPNPISALLTGLIAFLPSLFVAVALIVVAAAVASGVRGLVTHALGSLSYGDLVAKIASAFIIGLGIIAALGQVGVALTVTMPVLMTVLATAGGILIVGVGGGLIKPAQERWEKYLAAATAENKSPEMHGSEAHVRAEGRNG